MSNAFANPLAVCFIVLGIGGVSTELSFAESATLPRKGTLSNPIRIACIGDSITFGVGIEDREHNSYPAVLQRLLGDSFQVGNFGRSGADVLLINNGPYAGTSEHRAALAHQPDVVICNLGINDHAIMGSNADAFVKDYVALLRQYSALPSKPQLLIWTKLAPVMPGHRNYKQCEQLRSAYASLLQKVASKSGAQGIDMYAPLAGHPEWFPDHLHPNSQGARVIAESLANTLAHLASRSSAQPNALEVTCDQGFEGAPVGEMRELTSPIGRWTAEAKDAEINAEHVRSGERSLRILGGVNRSVQLAVPLGEPKRKLLSFWAERWTSRGPFRFRIEQRVESRWVELYVGDNEIQVGGFRTHVTVPLREAKQIAIRMLLTTPDSSGLLVDDVKLADVQPMKAIEATIDQPTLPALVGTEWSAITRIKVNVDGNLAPAPVLTELKLSTGGTTDPSDIAKIRAFYVGGDSVVTATGNANAFADAIPFGEARQPDETVSIEGNQALSPGANYFWIAYQLKELANIDHRVNAVPTKVQLAGGHNLPLSTPTKPVGQGMGVAVRRRGDDGVHTYRIPGLATTDMGTLIGVYDIRRRSGGDLPGDVDVGMSRSTDGGQTWEPMQVIMDMGNDPEWRCDGIGDPAVLVDHATNTIWVAAVWSHGNRGWNGSQPGLEPEETGQLMLVRSDDEGRTWSKPINITKQVKRPEWCFLLQGPGNGITMIDGTLVFAAQFQDTPANNRLPRSTILYSRDHGETWNIGNGAFEDTTEAQVVEVEPGVLMLNCRYNRSPRRVVTISEDLGQTWHEHPSSRQALLEPRACMASLIRAPDPEPSSRQSLLLFSNPNHPTTRQQMTIKASRDHGQTWPTENQVLLDQATSAGYSCMSMIDDQTVGILYEGSQAHMTFQRVKLQDIVAR